MTRLSFVLTVLTVAGLVVPSNVEATPITYHITGTASGAIGSTTTFTNAQIDLIGQADTSTVATLSFQNLTYYANPLISFTVTIAGVGTATITDPSALWMLPGQVLLPDPVVLLGRIDAPPALDSFTGIGITSSPFLAGYAGATAIGPVTGPGGIGFNPLCGTGNNDPCIGTTLGFLSFTTNNASSLTPTTFTATTAPVPEPATGLLLGSGFVALASRYRTRSRRLGR